MKPHRLLIIFFTAVFLCLSGCNAQKEAEYHEAEYHAYEVGLYDCHDIGNHSIVLPDVTYTESYNDDSAPEELSITFEGKTYVGHYRDTRKYPSRSHAIHRYSAEGEWISEFAWFSVNAETNALCEIGLSNLNDDGLTATEEECRKAADEFAARYIELSDYKVEVREIGDTPLYNFTYYIELDGFKTSEQLVLGTNRSGKVYYSAAYNLGMFHDRRAKNSVPLSSEKLQNAVEAKLRSVYDSDSSRLVSYKINHATLTEYNGKRAIYYIIDPQVESSVLSDYIHSCLIDLLVVEE